MLIFDYDAYDELTPKQQKAITLYFEWNFNIRMAARRAKYSEEAFRLFIKTPKARAILKAYAEYMLDEKKDTLEYQIVKVYMIRAFYDPADIIDDQGFLLVKDLKELGELSQCVDGIEKSESWSDGGGSLKMKVKLCDREKALEQLCKYISIMKDSVEITRKGPIDLYRMSRKDRKKRTADLIKKRSKKK